MATNKISGSDSVSDLGSRASIGSSIYALPDALIQNILQHLSASDLCHVASCSRWLRDATNQDSRWRYLCQNRVWEHYGTTTDLAKIASYYGPSEQATGAREAGQYNVTFQEDRIVTDDNTVGLTSTCSWKGVYMRAYHLDRNWATNCSYFKEMKIDSQPLHPTDSYVSAHGDLLALSSMYTVHVFDIRKETLQRFIRTGVDLPIEMIKIKDDVMVVGCRNGTVLVYDARTGQRLQVMDDCRPMEVQSLFFDGEVVIAETYVNPFSDNGYIYVWRVEDGKRRLLNTMDDSEEIDGWRDLDYRNKLLAAYHANNYICVWDVRSGDCLHKLNCPGTTANVKLGDNVIVGFSTDYIAKCVIISIWSLDTGECQHEIPLQCDNLWQPRDRHPYHLVNRLIILLIRHLDHAVVAYDLRGRLVTEETPIKFPTYRHPMIAKGRGSKCSFNVLIDKELLQYNEFIFEATPSGLVILAAVDPDLCDSQILCMDEIRMIRYDARKERLLIYHYW